MARIPLGNAGNLTPARAPSPQAPMDGGMAVGRAVADLGGTGVQIGLTKEADQLRMAWDERKQQEAQAEAAARAADTLALRNAEDALRDAHEELATGVVQGTVPKDKADATWGERSKAVLDERLKDLRESSRPMAQAHLQAMVNRYGNGVRKAVEKRDRQDTTVAFDAILESAQRTYATDRAGAAAIVNSTAQAIGPFTDYTPEALARKVQQFHEGAQYTLALAALSAGRYDGKALKSAEAMIAGLDKLDPQRRVELGDRAQNYRVQQANAAEIAQRRALAAQEHRLKVAEAAYTSLRDLSLMGTLNDQEAQAGLAQMAGTPFAGAFKQMIERQRVTGPMAAQPPRVLQQQVDAINAQIAKTGITQELVEQRETILKVKAGQDADIAAKGGLRAAGARGLFELPPPLDMTKGLDVLVPAMRERVDKAAAASRFTGKPESPLYPEEAAALKRSLDELPPKQRSTWVAGIAAGLGRQASQGLAAQIAGNESSALAHEFAYAAAETTNGRLVSELIAKGAAARKDGTSRKAAVAVHEIPPSSWESEVAMQLDGLYPNQLEAGKVREAALYIADGIASEGGGALMKKDLHRAVRLAMGGQAEQYNGARIPLPAGFDTDMVEKRMRSVGAADLAEQAPGGAVIVGGVPMPLADFVKTLPSRPLIYARPGRYGVLDRIGGRPVLNSTGQAITIGLQ